LQDIQNDTIALRHYDSYVYNHSHIKNTFNFEAELRGTNPEEIRVPPWLFSSKLKPFIRSKIISNSLFRIVVVDQQSFWRAGNNIDAIEQLESVINQGNKVFIFGQFFNTGNGVHDIHQNQGDPINSQWAQSNGIWQDGATIIQRPDGTFVGFFNKFETQSFKTDDQGHPI
jgi:hypothetical protein